ncbi:MAG TPA: glycosyltransferase family 39 protein [Patescibacteria group bacterium]|nr:glycosyltransferase family 39 protein [Patescibacteria group bacterium]
MTRREALVLAAILVVAALLRLPGLADRGRFDADQGHDMLTLAAFTREGEVPLLGPKTSVGDFHHGAFYYFLLAPAAAVSDNDPVAVTTWLALLGIGAVALTYWLARSMAGPLAGATAALILTLSPAAIDESTFIWNPNPIPLFAALALAAAWRGRQTGRARWWAVAIGAAGAVVQLHVLGLVFFMSIFVLALLGLRRSRAAWNGIVGGLAIVAVLFTPLLIHELTSGFGETRLILDYFASGGGTQSRDPAFSILFTLLRIVGWPIVGLVTDVPIAAALVLAAFLGLVAWYDLVARGAARVALAWLVGVLAWSTVALALTAPGLQTVIAGLPNDHYHASLDPLVATLFGVSIAALLERAVDRWRARRAASSLDPAVVRGFVAGALGAVVLSAIVGAELIRLPASDPDGGWRAAQLAGARIVDRLHGPPVSIVSLPGFKSADGIAFPIEEAERRLPAGTSTTTTGIVIVCDRLLESQIGAACGGPAEDRFMFGDGAATPDPYTGITPSTSSLIDRFDASPRTSISVYLPVVTP